MTRHANIAGMCVYIKLSKSHRDTPPPHRSGRKAEITRHKLMTVGMPDTALKISHAPHRCRQERANHSSQAHYCWKISPQTYCRWRADVAGLLVAHCCRHVHRWRVQAYRAVKIPQIHISATLIADLPLMACALHGCI